MEDLNNFVQVSIQRRWIFSTMNTKDRDPFSFNSTDNFKSLNQFIN